MVFPGVFQQATLTVCKTLLNLFQADTVFFSQFLLHCR
jgi:hypothetical protein